MVSCLTYYISNACHSWLGVACGSNIQTVKPQILHSSILPICTTRPCRYPLDSYVYYQLSTFLCSPKKHGLLLTTYNSNACHPLFVGGGSRLQRTNRQIQDSSFVVPATHMLTRHLQLNAIHTTVASDPLSHTVLYSNKTNHTRTDLMFWVCMTLRNQFDFTFETCCDSPITRSVPNNSLKPFKHSSDRPFILYHV